MLHNDLHRDAEESRRIADQSLQDAALEQGSRLYDVGEDSTLDRVQIAVAPVSRERDNEYRELMDKVADLKLDEYQGMIDPRRVRESLVTKHIPDLFRLNDENKVISHEIKRVHCDKSLENFEPDLFGTTVEDILGKDFAACHFQDEQEKTQFRADLMQLAFNMLQIAEQGADEADEDFRARKKAGSNLLIKEMRKANPAQVRMQNRQNTLRIAEANAIRTTSISASMGGMLVECPTLGYVSVLPGSVLKNVAMQTHGEKFNGEDNSDTPLSSFLTIVSKVIMARYDEACAHQLLMYVLDKAPRETVRNLAKAKTPLKDIWMQIQTSYGGPMGTEGAREKLDKLLSTRPTNVHAVVANISNCVIAKNQNTPDLGTASVVNAEETRNYVFSLLKQWYPYYEPLVRNRFDQAIYNAAKNGEKPKVVGILIALIRDVIGQQPPIYRATSHAHALEYVDMARIDGLITEEELNRNLDRAYIAQVRAEADIARMGAQGARNATGGPQRPSRPPMRSPAHLVGRCFLCTSPDHFMNNCPTYKGERADTLCKYCKGMHSERCQNLSSEVKEAAAGVELGPGAANDRYGPPMDD